LLTSVYQYILNCSILTNLHNLADEIRSKRLKLDVRSFQRSWTADFGFVSRDDLAVCVLCCQNVVCRTSSTKRHFETKHEKSCGRRREDWITGDSKGGAWVGYGPPEFFLDPPLFS